MTREKVPDNSIAIEAAEWLQAGATDSEERRTAFYEWIKQSPQHYAEFLYASEIVFQLKTTHSLADIDVAQLVADNDANIVTLNPPASQTAKLARVRRPKSRFTAHRWRFPAMAATLILALAAIALWTSGSRSRTYTTNRTEQRTIKLADGSVVHLNTQSRLIARLTARSRVLHLEAGEALFTVARDPTRPFDVVAGATRIRAIGTEFNVSRYRAGQTTVAVVEGVVEVAAGPSPAVPIHRAARAHAGETLNVDTAGTVSRSADTTVNEEIAWQRRQLIFRDTPLAAVAEEFNRYNSPTIKIDGAALRNKKLSGTFSADRPEALLLFLERDPSIKIERGENGIAVSSSP